MKKPASANTPNFTGSISSFGKWRFFTKAPVSKTAFTVEIFTSERPSEYKWRSVKGQSSFASSWNMSRLFSRMISWNTSVSVLAAFNRGNKSFMTGMFRYSTAARAMVFRLRSEILSRWAFTSFSESLKCRLVIALVIIKCANITLQWHISFHSGANRSSSSRSAMFMAVNKKETRGSSLSWSNLSIHAGLMERAFSNTETSSRAPSNSSLYLVFGSSMSNISSSLFSRAMRAAMYPPWLLFSHIFGCFFFDLLRSARTRWWSPSRTARRNGFSPVIIWNIKLKILKMERLNWCVVVQKTQLLKYQAPNLETCWLVNMINWCIFQRCLWIQRCVEKALWIYRTAHNHTPKQHKDASLDQCVLCKTCKLSIVTDFRLGIHTFRTNIQTCTVGMIHIEMLSKGDKFRLVWGCTSTKCMHERSTCPIDSSCHTDAATRLLETPKLAGGFL